MNDMPCEKGFIRGNIDLRRQKEGSDPDHRMSVTALKKAAVLISSMKVLNSRLVGGSFKCRQTESLKPTTYTDRCYCLN